MGPSIRGVGEQRQRGCSLTSPSFSYPRASGQNLDRKLSNPWLSSPPQSRVLVSTHPDLAAAYLEHLEPERPAQGTAPERRGGWAREPVADGRGSGGDGHRAALQAVGATGRCNSGGLSQRRPPPSPTGERHVPFPGLAAGAGGR